MAKKKKLLSLIDSMIKSINGGGSGFTQDLENEFRAAVIERPEADEELASILPELVPKDPKDEPRINVALDILSWLLEELRIDMERGREGARERLEKLQAALARHVFVEGGDAQLCAAVGRNLVESRVEIMPVMRQANRRRLLTFTDEGDGNDPGEVAPLIAEALGGMDIGNPHEALGMILDQTGLLEPEYQVAIAGEMLGSESVLLRDTAAIMLFHPMLDVGRGVAEALSRIEGGLISSETLRRLIIVRNWFPPDIRALLDMAIGNARRARVECAPMKGNPVHSVFATTIDGAGAQSFWIAAGVKKHVELCNILWKQGVGVIDSFIHRLPSVKAAERFMEGLPDMMCFADVGMDFLDNAICCAIGAGVGRNAAPHRGLLQIAELIGTDRWKCELFEPERELARLRGELKNSAPGISAADALEDSVDWPGWQNFADAWFEDDEKVDSLVRGGIGKRGRNREERIVFDILEKILEPRRRIWLERLILMTMWLKSSRRPPLPWQSMFHLAEAIHAGKPLREIPLMHSVAAVTFAVAMERMGGAV